MTGHSETPDNERLVSWKRISQYLQCSERTARRWRDQEGLPVHSHTEVAQSSVFAYKHELDQWLKQRASEKPPENVAAPKTLNAKRDVQENSAQQKSKALSVDWRLVSLIGLIAITGVFIFLQYFREGFRGSSESLSEIVANRLMIDQFSYSDATNETSHVEGAFERDFNIAFNQAGFDIERRADENEAVTAEFLVSGNFENTDESTELAVEILTHKNVLFWSYRFEAPSGEYEALRKQAAPFVTSVLRCTFSMRAREPALSFETLRLFARACTAERQDSTSVNRIAYAEAIQKSAPESPLTNSYLGGTMAQDALGNPRLTAEERDVVLERARSHINRALQIDPDYAAVSHFQMPKIY